MRQHAFPLLAALTACLMLTIELAFQATCNTALDDIAERWATR